MLMILSVNQLFIGKMDWNRRNGKIDFFPQGYIIDFASKNKGENQRKELIEPLLREEQQYCDGLDVLQDFYSTHTGILHTQYSRILRITSGVSENLRKN